MFVRPGNENLTDSTMTISLKDLETSLDSLLSPREFRDYCPNGLQVEGRAEALTWERTSFRSP